MVIIMKKSLSSVVILGSLILNSPVLAQSIVPASDGTGTIVNQNGVLFNIEGGTLSGDGTNLFQSFSQFNLTSDQIANFISNPNINNILTRIIGGNPSSIDGLIQLTGGNSNLFIMNPAGLIFGSNFSLNVPADFTATTATGIGFNHNWFNAFGDNNYNNLNSDPSSFAFNLVNNGVIINSGKMEVTEGNNVNLIGGTVINTGTITAPEGTININAVEGTKIIKLSQEGSLLSLELDLTNSNLNLSDLTPLDLPALLTGGNVNTGLEVGENNTVNLVGSDIALPTASGTSIVSGMMDVSGDNGGTIRVLGDTVGSVSSNINASGILGDGGTILIGGDYQGQGDIPRSQLTAISSDSFITANAGTVGNGGTVVVWSDGLTNFYGDIEARGGTVSGNGGMVEVSGKNYLVFRGMVDAGATDGLAGTLLLDPKNITIDNTTIAVFANPTFIDVTGGSGSEGLTIQSSLTNLGYNVITFTGYTATHFTNAAASANIILIPEQEKGSLFNALDASAQTQLANLINAGGGFIINGGSNDISLLNGVFGYALTSGSSGTATLNNIVASGTSFAGGSATLPVNSDTKKVGNLPTGALNLYSDGGTDSTVFASNYGAGKIVYLGWDWYDASPLGATNGGWLNVLDRSVQFVNTNYINLFNNNEFAENPASNVTIAPSQITDITNTGTALILQANNDITVNQAITSTAGGGGGDLTLQAGRSILLNANITTDNGNLSLLANNTFADSANRDAGTADITMKAGTSINTGTRNLTIGMGTLGAIGDITLENITGNAINITGNEINFNGIANSIKGSTLTLAPTTSTQNIQLGGTEGTMALDISATDLLALTDGFSNITINNLANTGTVTLNTGITFNDPVNIAGGSTLVGTNSATTWTLTGANQGSLSGFANGLTFASIENLTGNDNIDKFIFSGGNLTGKIDGQGGLDELDYSLLNTALSITLSNTGTVDGFQGTEALISGGFDNINSLIGGTDNDTLVGSSNNNTFNITGADIGDVDGNITFSFIENLSGGDGDDSFILNGGTLTGKIDGLDGNDTLTGDNLVNTFEVTSLNSGNATGIASFSNIENLIGNANTDSFILNGGTLNGSINGQDGNDTLTGDNLVNTFEVTSLNSGNATGIASFSNIENLIGNANTDSFILNGGTLTGKIDGLDEYDTLTGDNVVNTFEVTSLNSGNATGIASFSNIENLIGNADTDSFILNGGTLEGKIDGLDGDDTLTGDNVVNTFEVTSLNSGNATGIASFSNIENLIGNANTDSFILNGGTLEGKIDGLDEYDTLTGDNLVNTFEVTSLNSGNATGIASFSNIENLIGNANTDSFILNGGTLEGKIDGQDEYDTLTGDDVANTFEITSLNRGTVNGITNGFSNIENLTGNAQDDSFIFNGGTVNGILDGQGGDNTLFADNVSNIFEITGLNTGTATGTGGFLNLQNIIGNAQDDTFIFIADGRLDGRIDGKTGINIIDYSASTIAGVIKITGLGTIMGSQGVELFTLGGGFDNVDNIIGGDVSLSINDKTSLTWALAEEKISSSSAEESSSESDSASVDNTMSGANFGSYCHASLLGSFEGDNLAGIRKFEQEINGEVAERYTGNNNISCQGGVNSQDKLKQIEEITGIRGAIVYLRFVPEFEIITENDFIWESNKSSTKSELNGNKSSEEAEDTLEITIIMPSGEIIKKKIPEATRENVKTLVNKFLAAVTDTRRKKAYVNPSQQLYNLMIAPIEADLKNEGINNLSFVVDGELRSLSFAALYDEKTEQFLIEKYSVGRMPSFSLTNTEYFDLRQTPILAMGSEKFENENQEQSPLPAVPFELSLITDQIWEGDGTSFLNENFTIDNLQKLREGGIPYGIVHLATHGEFRSGSLANSYIQFWDEKLSLDKLELLKLSNPPVDLLVLSACKTAVGDEEAELGFAGLAIAAGVKTTLGSLWYVSDQGTLALMTTFYRQLRTAPIKAEALRQAQLGMIHGTTHYDNRQLITNLEAIPLSGDLARQGSPDLSHPYYWSAFTLVGSPW